MLNITPSRSLDKNNYTSRIPFQLLHSSELIPLKRENIISKFTQKELNSCWESLATNIIQNYQRGKGTLVKGFGTFTFKSEIIKKSKKVFIIFILFNITNRTNISSLNLNIISFL